MGFRDRRLNLLAVGAILVLAAIVVVRMRPPASHPGVDADYVRAVWNRVAAEPHPAGSEANDRVRAHLVDELARLGLSVTLQPGTGEHWRTGEAVELVNVVARLEGTAGGDDAVVLVAHYDSRAGGSHGAADDGAGVAAVLEAARQLAADPPANDVIVLLTDAEEAGLLGAIEFVTRTAPDYLGARAVINFEARGGGGPPILFETGRRSGTLVDAYARVATRPVASSLADAVYALMPNATDFTVLKYRPGDVPEAVASRFPRITVDLPGLNFAFIDRYHTYHTPLDTVANTDFDSVLAHASLAVGLSRELGDADLDAIEGDRIFFDYASAFLVNLPRPLGWVLVALGVSQALLAVPMLRELGGRAVLGGAVRLLLATVAVAIVAQLVALGWIGVAAATGADAGVLGRVYPLIWVALFAAIGWAVTRIAGPAADRVVALAALVAAAVSALAMLAVPGASYLPALFAVAAGATVGQRERPELTLVPVILVTPPIVSAVWLVGLAATWTAALAPALLMAIACVLWLPWLRGSMRDRHGASEPG